MLPSVRRNVDVTNTSRALNTGRGSDAIVLIEAGGFYSRKYGKPHLLMYYCDVAS